MVSFATRNVEKPEKTWKMNPRKLGNKAGISWWRLDQVSGGLYFTIHPSTSHQISLRFQGPHSKSDKLLFKMKNCFFFVFWGKNSGEGLQYITNSCDLLRHYSSPPPSLGTPPATFAVSDIGLGGSDHHRFGPPKKTAQRERMAWRIWRHLKDKNNDCSIESSVLTLR